MDPNTKQEIMEMMKTQAEQFQAALDRHQQSSTERIELILLNLMTNTINPMKEGMTKQNDQLARVELELQAAQKIASRHTAQLNNIEQQQSDIVERLEIVEANLDDNDEEESLHSGEADADQERKLKPKELQQKLEEVEKKLDMLATQLAKSDTEGPKDPNAQVMGAEDDQANAIGDYSRQNPNVTTRRGSFPINASSVNNTLAQQARLNFFDDSNETPERRRDVVS